MTITLTQAQPRNGAELPGQARDLFGAVISGVCAVASGFGSYFAAHPAHSADSPSTALTWALTSLLCAALSGCLLHLSVVLILTVGVRSAGTHTMHGSAMLRALKVLAPRTARNIMVASTTATCALVLAANPGYASHYSHLNGSASPHITGTYAAAQNTPIGSGKQTTVSYTETDDSDIGFDAPTTEHGSDAARHASEAAHSPGVPSLGWGEPVTEVDSAELGSSASAAGPRSANTSKKGGGSGEQPTPQAPVEPSSHGTMRFGNASQDATPGGRPPTSTIVAYGDSLWSIAKSHLKTSDTAFDDASVSREVEKILRANPSINDPSLIYPGQQISLPNPNQSLGH